jgi:hypothetical protein
VLAAAPGSLAEIMLFPRSGFINRLQTLASASIMAEQTGAPLRVCWLPCPFVQGPAVDTFSQEWCQDHEVDEGWVRESYGLEMADVPLYVTWNRGQRFVGLRGHDRGEQALLPEFWKTALSQTPAPRAVLVTGGSFYTPSPGTEPDEAHEEFLIAKRDFYRALPLAPEVEVQARSARDTDPRPYLGLHLRYTDRMHETPYRREIRAALRRLADESGLDRLFVASDSREQRQYWVDEAARMGLKPWTFDASGVRGPTAAMVDWRLLGYSQRLVYFTASSYSVEAAVASGSWRESIGLGGSPVRSLAIRATKTAQAGWRRARGR